MGGRETTASDPSSLTAVLPGRPFPTRLIGCYLTLIGCYTTPPRATRVRRHARRR